MILVPEFPIGFLFQMFLFPAPGGVSTYRFATLDRWAVKRAVFLASSARADHNSEAGAAKVPELPAALTGVRYFCDGRFSGTKKRKGGA